MDEKIKDTVFGVVLFALGSYVAAESVLMIGRAANPPLRIRQLSVSPGLFPLVLGLLLVLFSVLLIAGSLKGNEKPLSVFADRLKTSFSAMRAAFGNNDFLSMLIGVVMMFVYCFFVVGNIPFWGGAVGFLVAMMVFLRFAGPAGCSARAANLGVIVLTALVSASLVVFLFEKIFKTVLP
ncbi:MAG: tripartite tricarboxylate transporter TctB family protein [Candidatus Accumulibacter sp.]|jgi:hypothetical protein|nr:tripartite tricarboxylate transporter TctB family protein [Accumulibacter sp.]